LVSPLFFDTSVIVAGTIDFGISSEAALRVLGAIALGRLEPPATAWHCCLEFFAVTTRLPPEYRLTPTDSVRILQDDVLARWTVCDLPAGDRSEFLSGLVRDRVVGGRLYDAHIAETARLAGARTVVTENPRHFTGLLRQGVRVLSAAEFVADPEFTGG
jgi:predicted nucleic acid-binding protein